MKEEELNNYFYRVVDKHLLDSLDAWQISYIKEMLNKAYKKGKKSSPHYQ